MRPRAHLEVERAQKRSFLGDLGCVEASFGSLRVLLKEVGDAGPGAAQVENFRNNSDVAKRHEMMGNGYKRALEHILRSNARKIVHFGCICGGSRSILVVSECCARRSEAQVRAPLRLKISDKFRMSQNVMK